MNIEEYENFVTIRELLKEDGFDLDSDTLSRINAHLSLVRSIGSTFGVVSDPEIRRGAHDHVVDSLSLVSHMADFVSGGFRWVDVGSGGGFPGLVCASVFPEVPVVLIDRSSKKCAFLRRCVAELDLPNVTVLDILFDDFSWEDGPAIVMVRGLERASVTVPELVSQLAVGSRCFWLTGSMVDMDFGPRFHVEQIVDNWSAAGLRRGALISIEVGRSSEV
jgi:16S rRNA (guanine(527)-N(7))-methyltransferase RsmG